MALLDLVQTAESAGVVVVGLLCARLLWHNARHLRNAKQTLRYLKALICLFFAALYLAVLLNLLDPLTLSLYARPLLLMLLLSLFGREWLERIP